MSNTKTRDRSKSNNSNSSRTNSNRTNSNRTNSNRTNSNRSSSTKGIDYRKINAQWFALYKNTTDPKKKSKIEERLINLNIKIVHGVLHANWNKKILPFSSEELFSFGQEALWTAIKHFDPTLGYEFSTFATRHVNGRILRAIRDQGSLIRIPQKVQHGNSICHKHVSFIPIDAEDVVIQLDCDYPIVDIDERVEQMLKVASQVQVDNNNWRQAFTQCYNMMIESGLVNARKDNTVSKVTNNIENVQLSFI